MVSPSSHAEPLSDLVARCVLAIEREGDAAAERELAACPELAAEAREQLAALRRAGLLVPPIPPEHLGPYRVVRRLGIGGMGTVWLCEQERPIHRQVAVKVMRAGFDHDEMLVRFHVERQALGSLTDPCIARVLDSGVTADRRPYLVMDYVPGAPMTQFADEHRLSLAARLSLFAQVCDAVQHAHTKGVLHRDLKPSNVLVVERDGAPLPVVIDFGVAKFVHQALQTASPGTLPGRLVGTPEYMSPEQARGDVDVDTRTDVYSLGVLLYELLTGCLPHSPTQLRNLAELGRVLAEVEPPAPAARLAALAAGEAAAAAAARALSPLAHLRGVRGELEWIAARAMAKERERRYVTAAELAQDVRRFLQQQPIVASPPSRLYALRKFCQRHRLPVAILAAFTLTLAGLTTVSLVFWREAAAAEVMASDSNARLEQNLEAALTALDHMVALGADGLRTPATAAMRRELLHTALALHEQLAAGGAEDPRLAAALAAALGRSAQLHQLLGEHADALAQLERAEAALQGQRGVLTIAAAAARGRALLSCGAVRRQRGEPELAIAHYRAARAAFESAGTASGGFVRTGQVTALRQLAELTTANDVLAARALLEAAQPLAEAELLDAAATREQRVESVAALVDLAWHDGETERGEQAVRRLSRSEEVIEARLAEEGELSARLGWMPVLRKLANVSMRLREDVVTRRAVVLLITTLRAAVAAEPAVAMHRFELAQALQFHISLTDEEMTPAAAMALEHEALALAQQAVVEQGDSPELQDRLFGFELDFCRRCLERLDGDEAVRAAVDLADVQREADRAEAIWQALPESYRRDRHPRESWLGGFVVRALLAKQRGDEHRCTGELEQGMAQTSALAAEYPTVVQFVLLRAEMALELGNSRQRSGDVDGAWRAGRQALTDLAAVREQFTRPSRWVRLAWLFGPLSQRLAALAPQRRDVDELRQVCIRLAEVLAVAARADDRTIDALRDRVTAVFAAAVAAGMPRAELAAAGGDALRDWPAFVALRR